MQHESTSTDNQGSKPLSIAEEVQASAQIADNEEIVKPPIHWRPLSLQDESGKWEISIIRQDFYEEMIARTEEEEGYSFIPFGGGHVRKIVLFGSEKGENQLPESKVWIDWGMGIAHSMALSFNDGKYPFPEVENNEN